MIHKNVQGSPEQFTLKDHLLEVPSAGSPSTYESKPYPDALLNTPSTDPLVPDPAPRKRSLWYPSPDVTCLDFVGKGIHWEPPDPPRPVECAVLLCPPQSPGLLTKTAWRCIRKGNSQLKKKQKKHKTQKPANKLRSQTSHRTTFHSWLLRVDFKRLIVVTSKIYYSFYNKTVCSKEWCSDNIYLAGFSFLGHINILLYFVNSSGCLLNLV